MLPACNRSGHLRRSARRRVACGAASLRRLAQQAYRGLWPRCCVLHGELRVEVQVAEQQRRVRWIRDSGCTNPAPLDIVYRLVLVLDHHGRCLDQLLTLLTRQPLKGEEWWRFMHSICGGENRGGNVPGQVECREDDAPVLLAKGALRLAKSIA